MNNRALTVTNFSVISLQTWQGFFDASTWVRHSKAGNRTFHSITVDVASKPNQVEEKVGKALSEG